jgi:hypothetical protein
MNLKLKIFMRLKYLLHLIFFYIFKFDHWHISSIESREYCLKTLEYINSNVYPDDCIVEVGCGLGETISKVNASNLRGYDTSSQVIQAAKLYHCRKKVSFEIGSFDSFKNYNITYLIALNFLHDFDSQTASNWLNQCTQNNKIQFFIVDEIKDRAYQNNHNFIKILPKNFLLVDTIGEEYRYNRSIKVFKNLEITS